ncbi:MAG TPA: CbiX/SirB N-terminal domain-containing protein [Pirellulales bacterium]|jgi:sirohydrochlorin cobaltochelatase|nr:CbiX/SirB N-terminal domain-containing protein [Pirellulales bacterium]
MKTDLTADQPVTDRSMTSAFDALLIVGHGTRDPAGLAEFQSFVDQVARQRTDWHVAGCFLELAEPSIATAVDRLAAGGKSRIRAMPLVLFSAGHAKRDIPDALAQAIARNPGLEIELCSPLGHHPAILQLSLQRCRQALSRQEAAAQAAISPDETLLILVGRGSSDIEATAQMRLLAELRRAGTAPLGFALGANEPSRGTESGATRADAEKARESIEEANLRLAHVEIGFVAVATPSLDRVLEEAAGTDFRRVIVQPHLLFAGSVLTEIHRLVERRRLAEQSAKTPGRQWIVTEALGPDRRVVTAVVDIVSSATPRSPGD